MTLLLRKFIMVLIMGAIVYVAPLNAATALVERKEVKSFIDNMVKSHSFDKNELITLFNQVTIFPSIIETISKPAESKPWYEYRPIFLGDSRIKQGVEFWGRHKELLERASDEYGVPVEIIVAILGVETRYGRYAGKHKVMDALATLAFDYPKRSKFFTKELEEYLLLTRAEGIDPLALKGSYAGAMGKPQFISSSYRNYAVDFDGDGVRDLLNSTADAIGSVANYFKQHKWEEGGPIVSHATVKGKKYKKVVDKGIKPHMQVGKLEQYGVSTEDSIPGYTKAALIELEIKGGKELWVGYQNFYVITRYNHSPLYAMAVFQLSQKIREKVLQ
jgi:membrane-bound lytic murein transglycosylase B